MDVLVSTQTEDYLVSFRYVDYPEDDSSKKKIKGKDEKEGQNVGEADTASQDPDTKKDQ